MFRIWLRLLIVLLPYYCLTGSLLAIEEIPLEHKNFILNRPYRVLGIGHACMDLLIPVEESFLSLVRGEKGGQERIEIQELQKLLEKAGSPPLLATGGSSANTIKALKGLGESCAFLSLIGSDAMGERFAAYMQELDIVPFFSFSSTHTTQILCMITPDGQRTMRFCPGSSEDMSEECLHADYFSSIDLVHLDAYNLRNRELVETAVALAKKSGARVSLDLSCFELVRLHRERLLDLLDHGVDIVFANEDEIKALTGLNPIEGCLKLQERVSISIVLMNDKGCLIGHNGVLSHVPAFKAAVVDTTGAGDLFASGFLYGYLRGYSLEKCGKIGNLLGATIVETIGAELSPEKLQTIRDKLSSSF